MEEEIFVDKHRVELIRRVTNVAPILEELLKRDVINQVNYDKIRANHDSQETMRALLSGPLESSGVRGKQIFHKILERNEPHLIDDLKRTERETVMDVKVMDTVQVGSMMDKKLLIEILNDLSSEEFEKFKSLIELEKDFPLISRSRLDVADMQETVELMVETNSRECVEVTKKVLKEMNRTDLVQRLSDISSRTKEKHLEHRPTLIQRVETMTSVIELLLETLADLSNRELEYFKQIIWSQSYLYKPYLEISWMLLMMADMQDTVFIMVQTFSQQSVEETKDILIQMNRRDLVQRLSDSSSGPKKKHSVDEHLSALIHKVATKTAVRELLLETLNDLSDQELTKLKWLLQFTYFKKDLPWIQLEPADRTEVVDLMVETYGQQSVEVIREVFMEMKKTDLVQRLSETSSEPRAAGSSVEASGVKTTEGEKHSVDEQWPALIQRVETMTSVIELLLETLADLSDRELEVFKKLLQSRIHLRKPYLEMLMRADMQDIVFIMVQTFGQQSVKKTKDILIKMNRRDLVQRLSDSSSGPKKKHSVDEHLSALIHKVATKTAVRELLLETLNDLSDQELKTLKWLLQFTHFKKGLPFIPWIKLGPADRTKVVDLMVERCGQQSVEVIREVFKEMKRTDLVQRLSETSSVRKEKHSVDEQWPALIHKVETMTSVIELLLETLADLSDGELKNFKKLLLSQSYLYKPYLENPWRLLMMADMQDTVFIMVQTFSQQSVKKTEDVLIKMKRRDLVQRLSDSSSGPKKKHSVDEHLSALIHKVATKTAVRGLLLETLNDLSDPEFNKIKWLLQFTYFKKDFPWIQLEPEDRTIVVDRMVERCGQQSVEVIREVFMEMKRTDLVQRLSETISGPRAAGSSVEAFGVKTTEGEKYSVDEQWPALIQKVETMTSVIELLLETLADLSDGELEDFKKLLLSQSYLYKPYLEMLPMKADMQDTVFSVVQTFGQQSVKNTKDVLIKMNKRDLVQRLSDSSSGPKKKYSVDEHLSALIHKVATKTAVRELLLETLNDLNDQELKTLKWLLQFTYFKKGLPCICSRLDLADRTEVVDLMVERCGQQSVEVIREVFMEMKRTDLVQRLSETSTEPRAAGSSVEAFDVKTTEGEKHSVDEQWPALIQRVETMTSVIELLLETLADLSNEELEDFKKLLLSQSYLYKPYLEIPWRLLMMADMQETALFMVETFGQQSVKKTKDILIKMNRRDMVQKLSDSSSGPKKKYSVDEHLSALIHKVATKTAVRELLLETLNDLSDQELKTLKWLLQFTHFKKDLPCVPLIQMEPADRTEVVDLMMKTCCQQSVEVIREVFVEMKRTDLVQRLSETISGPKAAGSSVEAFGVKTTEGEKHSVDEQWPALIQKVETMTSVIELLLETLADLNIRKLKNFKQVLRSHLRLTRQRFDINWRLLKITDMQEIVLIIVQEYGQQSMEMMKKVLKDMNSPDLVQRLSDCSSGPKKKHYVDEQLSTPIQKVATMAAVKEMLLETLNDLSFQELKKFKEVLQLTVSQKDLPDISLMLINRTDRVDIVNLMLQNCGQQSVDLTKKIFKKMSRSDLVQRLSDTSSGPKEKQRSSLPQKDITMTSVKKKILETLEQLSFGEIKVFKWFLLQMKVLPRSRIERADRMDLVDLMVNIYSQQSVKVTREVLKKMNRMDLVQRLSDTSSGSKDPSRSLEFGAHGGIMDETMTQVKEKLLETLEELSFGEIEQFKWWLHHPQVKDLPRIPRSRIERAYGFDLVDLMVEIYGQQSVEVTREVLKKMNRMDLVQSLSDTSSGSKGPSRSLEFGAHGSIMDETMTQVRKKLLETLEELSFDEIKIFKWLLHHLQMTDFPRISRSRIERAYGFDLVDLMVKIYGPQSVEVTREVLKKMNRMDLVQRLSDTSSGSEGPSRSLEFGAHGGIMDETMTPVNEKLLRTLEELRLGEIEQFKWLLQHLQMNDRPRIPRSQIERADRMDLVDLMVEIYGQQSVEVTREVLKKMNRMDLVQSLSDTSSGSKGPSRSLEFGAHGGIMDETMTPVNEKLLETLEELHLGEIEQFKWLLQHLQMKDLPRISRSRIERADRMDLVDLMVEIYGQQSVEVTREVLKKMNRMDLVQSLSNTSSGSKGPSGSLEFGGHGSIMDSSDWTKLEPEVNSTDADEAPTYSLQSEAGRFECSVSDLRWVCEEKVSFKYQFWSWEEHMERMESLQYMPAGPLLDITVIAGKLNEVYLPHWICTDDSTILDKFAVLHVDACGDVVEDVSEVTSSHVKLSEPVFSQKGPMINIRFSGKIKCNVLIYYKTNTTFLKLHVYLIRNDPALKQTVKNEEESKGYEMGDSKSSPNNYLKLRKTFVLTSDIKTAEIQPEGGITLRYANTNFYEVFIENPDRNFNLTLSHRCTKKGKTVCKPVCEPVWACTIRKDDYPNSGHSEAAASSAGPAGATVRAVGSSSGATGGNTLAEGRSTGKHFVDKHRCDLIERVSNIGPILDNLWEKGIIQQGVYNEIMEISTTEGKMRKLYIGPLNACGDEGKDIFYKLLEEKEPYLVADLKKKES
ncbi:uncharacterized protein LOC122987727 isoform X2 [Thunnus albacares]|uniref:uncharacterized protein LOC122987727 isoform X2 n=1 Tax=Thunnus albacares TaxID=8236 RepID=UPI001CF6158D|nr:uncharacterized protein LOC122987727 isoform X2 [Thunnus albacares]